MRRVLVSTMVSISRLLDARLLRSSALSAQIRRRLFATGVQRNVPETEEQESADPPTGSASEKVSSETVSPSKEEVQEGGQNEEIEMVEMWNKDAPAGPEWNGPRGYEPTRHGDWSKGGRVSDF